ncbi:MAG: Tab2/Atab2 family RNA-binding protein [Halothece sp. Uz-M2-17]|nr:Tab2/Atab2 family RNA-binding protein [Halothece sp. Uz-M2-17]
MSAYQSAWQVDFYRLPQTNANDQSMWELVVCDETEKTVITETCPQAEATVDWLVTHLSQIAQGSRPEKIKVFRPQSLQLLQLAGEKLDITVEGTRHTPFLKQVLRDRAGEERIKIESPPPQPLPEDIWGDQWQFASLNAEEIEYRIPERPIPFRDIPPELSPFQLNLGSTTLVPGIIIYGGRKSWQLAQWFAETEPMAIQYIPTAVGESGGLILEAGLRDRWVIITFEDPDVAIAAEKFQQRKQDSNGLHFLLIQPDDSGMTDTGFWLLADSP